MTYPPKFGGTVPESGDQTLLYPPALNLDRLDVYVEDDPNSPRFFRVSNLPSSIPYGKSYFTISFNDPYDTALRLRDGSPILFEFKDSEGRVIFSDLTSYNDVNGTALAYVWVKVDPLRTFQDIKEGTGTMTIVGELDDVPPQYKDVYNVRLTIDIDVRRDLPNNTPILFQSSSLIQEVLTVSESMEYDQGSATYQRSLLNISASHLDTFGGQLKFIEVSYNEQISNADQFKFLTLYPVSASGEEYELTSSARTGLNPVSNFYKTPMPRDLRRGESVTFRLRFLNGAGQVAQDPTTGQDVIVSSSATFTGTPLVIEKDDNLITGSVGVGTEVGKGFKMSGESSAYIASADYLGFTSGSAGSGSGIMLFSGSVFSDITDDYSSAGLGFEIIADSSSYLRFRTNPKELDVRADAFFVGTEGTQFISASGGIIEVSSSNFHLSSSGDVTMAGTVTAKSGSIGGFTIEGGRLVSEGADGTSNTSITMSGADQLLRFGSGSAFTTAGVGGVLLGKDTDGVYKAAIGNPDAYLVFDGSALRIKSDHLQVTASDFEIDSSTFTLNATTLAVLSAGQGSLAAGNPRPTGIGGTNKGFYADGSGIILAGNANGPHISFDGTKLILSSSVFLFGQTGDGGNFISGSTGNIEISSSMFHLDPANNKVAISGSITATDGTIGAFTIGQDALSSTNFFISGAATGNEYFISASSGPTQNFNVKASGDVTASSLLLTGGTVAGSTVTSNKLAYSGNWAISASDNQTEVFISSSNFKVKQSGDITGSQVLFTGGKVGGATIDDTSFAFGSNSKISSSDRSVELFISSSQFKVKQDGDVTASNFVFGDKAAGNYVQFVDDTLTVEGTLTADTILTPSTIAGASSTYANASASIDSSGNAIFRSGSIAGFVLDPTKIADSNNNLILKSSGQITASAMSMSGTVTADSGMIAGWELSDGYISKQLAEHDEEPATSRVYLAATSSATQNIGQGLTVYRDDDDTQNGEIKIIRVGELSDLVNLHPTGSNDFGIQVIKKDGSNNYSNLVYIGKDEQKISGWKLSEHNLTAANAGLRLNAQGAKITIGSHSFAETGIQLDYNSGNPRFYVGTGGDYLRYDSNNGVQIKTKIATISGSSISLETPAFYLGEDSNYISGSGGTIEISSSGFHLKPTGDVILSGSVTAESGQIGGFVISNNSISSSNDLLILKSSGQITGSSVFIGNHSGSRLDFNDNNLFISSSDFFMGSEAAYISASNGNIKITSSMFHLDPLTGVMALSGSITADDGQIGGFVITKDKIQTSDGTSLVMNSAGQITGSDVLFSGGTITSDVTIQGDLAAGSISTPSGGSPLAIIDSRGFAKFVSASIAGFHITDSFISASSGQLTLKSSGQITASAMSMSGTVTADSGLIGGFELGSDIISASSGNLILKSSGQITGSAVSMSGVISATGGDIGGFSIDETTISSSNSNLILKSSGQITASAVSMSGTVTAESGRIGGFEIGSNLISASSGVLNFKSSGQITASAVSMSGTITAESGSIGGFDISNNQFTNQGGPGTGITITLYVTVADSKFLIDGVSAGNLKFLSSNVYHLDQSDSSNVGHPLRFSQASNGTHAGGTEYTTGVTTNGTPGDVSSYTQITVTKHTPSTLYYYCANHSGYGGSSSVEVDKTAMVLKGLTGEMTGSRFLFQGGKISGSDIEISVGTASLVSDSGVEISGSSFHLLRGNITASNVDLSGKITATSGEVGGWQIGSSQITSSNLILDSAGSLETSDYASDVRGWRISSDNSGEAEFQNVKIRGTLATTTFEKETVNAVGGQLLIANSTALTGSSTVSATETTMSVINVTGFSGSYDPTGPEGAGHSAIQNTTGSGDVLMIKKFSTTGFTTEYVTVQSASRDFPTSNTNFAGKLYVIRGYSGSVETDSGSVGDSPNSAQTYDPGQVLVSTGRSGSGFVRINANPNDLTTPYLDIVERTGSGIYDTDLKVRLGDLSGISSAQVGTNPGFGLFSENVFLTGKITATSGDVGGFSIDSTTVSSSNNNLILKSSGQITGSEVIFTGGKVGGWNISNTGFSNTGIQISSTESSMSLGTGGELLLKGGTNSPYISLQPSLAPQDKAYGEDGIMIAVAAGSTPLFSVVGSGGHFKFNGTGLDINTDTLIASGSSIQLETPKFYLGETAQYISGSNGNIEISSSNFHLLRGNITASNVDLTGRISASEGGIGGFSVTGTAISSSNNQLILKSSGQITASAVSMSGTVTADDGKIGGFIIGSDTISASAGTLHLKSSGQITASAISMSGTVTADAGQIAAWSINGTKLENADQTLRLNARADNPKITIGSGGHSFGDTGIQLGYDDSGVLKFHAGTSTDYLKYTTDTGIAIKTEILTASGSDIVLEAPRFYLGQNTTSYISGSNGLLEMSSSNFVLSPEGYITASAVSMSGTVSADSGLIGGFIIDSSTGISASAGNLHLKPSGQITASAVSMSGTITADDGKIGGFIIGSDTISASAGTLHLKSSGQITASAVSMSGTVTADSGLIGGFEIGSNIISASSGVLNLKSSGQITASAVSMSGTVTADSGLIGGFTIGSDIISASSGNLILKSSGQITASAVSMSGTVTADSGLIGGFEIGSSIISASSGVLNLKSSGQITASAVSMSGTVTADSGEIGGFVITGSAGQGIISASSGNLILKSSGQITASAVSMSGTVTANAGQIGGFEIGSNIISASSGVLNLKSSGQITASAVDLTGKITATSGDIGGFSIDGSTISSSNDLLILKSSGQITGSSVFFDDGKIGGFILTDNSISSSNGNLVLKSSGQITASAVSMSGTLSADAGEIGGFVITGSAGQGIISASSGNLILKSSGQITGSAISMSGTVSADAGEIGGFVITGSSGQGIISASSGNLILKSSGQITASDALMSGDLRASNIVATGSGIIGGFVLNSNSISSSNSTLILKSSGQITGSAVMIGPPTGSRLVFADGKLTISASDFFVGRKDGQYISGSNDNLVISSSNFRVSASDFFIGQAGGNGPKIQFFPDAATDSALIVSSSDFKMGSQHHYIKGENAQLEISSSNFQVGTNGEFFVGESLSGSRVEFKNNKFILSSSDVFLGEANTAFISSSNGLLEISSSNFVLSPEGQITASAVSMSGTITADAGEIGGFVITGSSGQGIISASSGNLILKSSGQITGSAVSMSGTITATSGEIGGFVIDETTISSSNDLLILKSSGQISGSAVLIGEITGSRLSFSDNRLLISASDFFVGRKDGQYISGSNDNLVISSSNFRVSASDFFVGESPSGSRIEFKNNNFAVSSSAFMLGSGLHYISASNSQLEISSSNFQVGTNGEFFVGESPSGSRIEFQNNKFVVSSSAFLLGDTATAFVSGSNTNIEISASNFHLTPLGNLTASNALFKSVTIIGGRDTNKIGELSFESFIGGGDNNIITGSSSGSAIVSGESNLISGSGYATILGSRSGSIKGPLTDRAFIAGGEGSLIRDGAYGSSIIAGENHEIGSTAYYSSIIGGTGHIIQSGSFYSTIFGGKNNKISQLTDYSFIGGGEDNEIGDSSGRSGILAGDSNTISTSSTYSVIVGGNANTIRGSNDMGVIAGGASNLLTGSIRSSIHGYRNTVNGLAWPGQLFNIHIIGEGIDAKAEHHQDHTFVNNLVVTGSWFPLASGRSAAGQITASGNVLVEGATNDISTPTVLQIGSNYHTSNNWMSIYAKDGGDASGGGITFYETLGWSPSAPQYGAKIVYNEDADQFSLGTMQDDVYKKQIYMPRANAIVYIQNTLRAAGDVVAYYSSDERLKNKIKIIRDPITKITKLRGVQFEWSGKWKEEDGGYPKGHKDSGIIAQDVQKVLPELVEKKESGYLGVRHDRLVGLLIEGIKEQQKQIDEMKKQIEEIKNGSTK